MDAILVSLDPITSYKSSRMCWRANCDATTSKLSSWPPIVSKVNIELLVRFSAVCACLLLFWVSISNFWQWNYFTVNNTNTWHSVLCSSVPTIDNNPIFLTLPAEFGDHQPDRHTAEYLKDFMLFPKVCDFMFLLYLFLYFFHSFLIIFVLIFCLQIIFSDLFYYISSSTVNCLASINT